MEIVALILLVLFSIIGFGAIFFTTFGTLIIFLGAVLFAFLTEFSLLTIPSLILLLILYLIGEVFEYFSVIIGMKKFGASNAAVVGALIGGIIGAVVGMNFLGVGLIIGTFLGIFLGAFTVEWCFHRDIMRSVKAGVGGVVGRVGSIAVKVIIALVMFGVIAVQLITHWR